MKSLVFQLSYLRILLGKKVYQESSTWRSFCLTQCRSLAHSGVTVREDTAHWRENINLLYGNVEHKRSQWGWPTACQEGKMQKLESEERLKHSFSGYCWLSWKGEGLLAPLAFHRPSSCSSLSLSVELITSKILPTVKSLTSRSLKTTQHSSLNGYDSAYSSQGNSWCARNLFGQQ